jgi:hypothetical protein
VEELRKKERQDETQFTTEMQRGAYFWLSPPPHS